MTRPDDVVKVSDAAPAWPVRLIATGLVGAVLFLVLYGVERQLWLDGTHSTFHAFHGWSGVVDSLASDSHPPLYFFFLAVWMQVGGLDEVWLRIPSIAFYLATGVVLYRFGARSGGGATAWLFALFFLCNPVAVFHAHTVRPYAMLGLVAAISTVLYLELAAARGVGTSRWVAYVTTNVLGTFTHYWFFLFLAGQGVGATLFARGRSRLALLVGLAISGLPFALLWTPVLLEQLEGTPTSWMPVPGGFWLVASPLQLFGGYDAVDFRRPALGFLMLVAVAAVLRPGRLPPFVSWHEVRKALVDARIGLLASIPIVVLVLAFAGSQIRPIFHVRYTIVAVPAVAILLGTVLSRLADPRWVPLPCVAIIAIAVLLRDDQLAREFARDNRTVTEFLVEAYQDGDEILQITNNFAPTTHYLRALAPDRSFSQTVFPAETRRHPGWRDARLLLEDTAALREEAAGVVQSLRARPGVGRVWLLAALEEDPVFTGIIASALEVPFQLERTIPVRGWWVSEVRSYLPRSPERDDERAPE